MDGTLRRRLITACSGDFGCYRVALAAKLAQSEFRVRFVGTREDESPLGALRHDGYGGRTAEFLGENMEHIYTANPADVILLHSGHNHSVEEQILRRPVRISQSGKTDTLTQTLLAKAVEDHLVPHALVVGTDRRQEQVELPERLVL